MWKSFILPIVIIFVYTVKAEEEIAVCSAKNEYIKFNVSNYIRFQSPNYPSLIYGNINSTCNASFLPETNGDYLWLTVLNGAFTNPFIINDGLINSIYKDYFESNYDVTTFTSTSGIINFELLYNYYGGTTAFWDAVVLSFSPSSAAKCPFSDKIITIDNETIIPISSDFGIPKIFTYPNCNWKFKNFDPENFQFKVYIKQLIYPYSLILSNMYFDGNVTIDDPQVRYFNGSDLTIMSINDNNDRKVSNGFFAIISLVPIKADYNEECQVQANADGTVAISNIDYENGYKPFSTCSNNISIPTGHEAILLISQYFLEAGVDKLTV